MCPVSGLEGWLWASLWRGSWACLGHSRVTSTKEILWIPHGPAELCFILMEAQGLNLEI